MARGKLPAATVFYDNNCRFRRLRGDAGMRFSISVQMTPSEDHETWWWSKPKKVELSSPNDKSELLALANSYRDELQRVTTKPVTVSDFIERWKTEREEQLTSVDANGEENEGNLKTSTLDREKTLLAHIDRYIGDVSLSDISTTHVKQMYSKMKKDGMSKSTRSRVHYKMRQLLDYAQLQGHIKENPCRQLPDWLIPLTPAPDPDRHEERKITLDEANALMDEIRKEPRDGLRAAIWLSYMLGLRRAECMGLKWSDFDASNDEKITVHIQRQMSRYGETPPKTVKADRVLPVAWPVWRYLTEWRDVQQQLYTQPVPVRDEVTKRKTGRMQTLIWSPDAYICCNSELVAWKPNGNFNRSLRKFFVEHDLGEWIVDDAGKKHYHGVGLHSLRHAFCTSLIRKGVDVTTAQGLLGHAEPITTLRWYSDDTEDGMREAAFEHARVVMTPADEAEMIQDPDMLEWMQENM